MSVLEIRDLKIYYPVRGGIFGTVVDYTKAVNGVSFCVEQGQTLGLIGESGCGKSSVGKAIMGLVPLFGGAIYFKGENIFKHIGKNRSEYRKNVQMIFQDVHSSLNAKKRVGEIIAEPLRNFEKNTKTEERKKIDGLLSIVGLSPLDADKYPHEFSGGQRQRIGIARAIALKPKLIVADEPVSALDLSIQAQVLNYMKDVQDELKLSYLFISHDMGVVKYMCENLAIMYNGKLVETGKCEDIFKNPSHIYTRRLIASIPDINPDMRKTNEERRRVIELCIK